MYLALRAVLDTFVVQVHSDVSDKYLLIFVPFAFWKFPMYMGYLCLFCLLCLGIFFLALSPSWAFVLLVDWAFGQCMLAGPHCPLYIPVFKLGYYSGGIHILTPLPVPTGTCAKLALLWSGAYLALTDLCVSRNLFGSYGC